MDFSKNTLKILNTYNVDPFRGFLPSTDPFTTLPPEYNSWEALGYNFTDYLNAGVIRENIIGLPLKENPVFENQKQTERAMLLLSIFAHAFVNSGPKKMNYIPSNISIPWVKIAKQLGRVPVLSHASLVLNNWRRLDPQKPIQLDNLATLFQFHGGLDEGWFYLITVQIEKVGAPAIPILIEGIEHLESNQPDKAIDCLNQAGIILQEMTTVLQQMYLHCDPPVFYKRVRPFLASFVEVDYQDTGLGKHSFHGGSAAQSSLIQFFDAVLGNRYNELPDTNNYLIEMRKYMPIKHADFLRYLESKFSFKEYINQSQLPKNKAILKLKTAHQNAINNLIAFRNEHLKMVSIYIIKQAQAANSEAIGTGGTNPIRFLKSIRNNNKR